MRTAYENDIKQAVSVMQQGGVILYPTDTIWGLGCDATQPEAVEKIFHIKGRDAGKSVIVLMTDFKQLLQYLANPLPDLESILKPFTEPTTIVYDQAINLPQQVIHSNGSLAVRITRDPFCRSLIKRLRRPLVSTSANRSGAPSPAHFGLVNPELAAAVDYVVQWRQDERSAAVASTILKLEPDGSLVKLR